MNAHSISLAVLATTAVLVLSGCGDTTETAADPTSAPTSATSATTKASTQATTGASTTAPAGESTDLPDVRMLQAVEADVDGDASLDRVELLLPAGTGDDEYAEQSWLRVTTADAESVVVASSHPTYVSLYRDGGRVVVPDLDGNGDDELVTLTTEGGDGATLAIWNWVDGALVEATPADGSPRALVSDGRLTLTAESTGYEFDLGGFVTWKLRTYPPTAPYRADAWTWQLDGTVLTAQRQSGRICWDPEIKTLSGC